VFTALLAAHALHVCEEAWGRFWLIDAVFGLRLFWLLNLLGFLLACGLFLGVRRRLRWAYLAGLAYAVFLALQGVGHDVAWVVSGRYFGGFAGGITGLALFAAGVPLARLLYQDLPARRLDAGA
jgi:hypothetical protein